METKLKQLIDKSARILITSHISPDPDAVSSLLLLSETLRLNYPDKSVEAVTEEQPDGLDFLSGYSNFKTQNIATALTDIKPDLFILLDGNNYERCSRHDGQKIREYIRANGVKTIVIDHHELTGKDEVDVFINNDSPATVQDIYEICFKGLNYKKPPGAEQTAMAGFYADTGGFIYVKAGGQDRIFGFASELVAAGADIETIKNHLESFSETDMLIIGELARNIKGDDGYSYSSLPDKFIDDWLSAGHRQGELQRPTNAFLNDYIRNIGGRTWGFIVYKNVLQGEGYYSVSLRSQAGTPDVSKFAAALGGGGHKPAAGAKFQASSLNEAIAKVKSVIISG